MFDFIVAAILLILCSIPMLILAILIRLRLGSPIFFRQVRPGLQGKPFVMIKFRTMTEAKNSSGKLQPDHMRLTPFGQFIRAMSLDEFPELWNVIRGEMSLVGPRPLLMEYLPLYSPEQARRHEVRPGLTGWAQVNGRNQISWEERFKLDVWYVDHRTFLLDLYILVITIYKVIRREGISQKEEVTMSKFSGTKS